MATNRSRFITSTYKITPKRKVYKIKSSEDGEDNINFSQDDGNTIDIDIEEIPNNETDIDNFSCII